MMNIGDEVHIRKELDAGHFEVYEIHSAYKSTEPAYDWWLEVTSYGGLDSNTVDPYTSYIPFKEDELILCDDAERLVKMPWAK